MKLQNMIIIFLIIVIPILLVFSVYFNGETRTLKLQREYDEVLKNATYDSILAFEKNSMSDMLSGNPESKRENIKAAINMYIKSLAGSQNLSAYNENDIKDHIPAVVFGLYDGFYMYTPTLKVDNTKYEHTLKNYVYYSEQIPDTDIVIRYSLDNYVAVSGTFDGIYMTKNGYLVTNNQSVNQEKLYENIVVEEEILNPGSDATYNYYLIPCQYKYNTDKIKIYKKAGEEKKLAIVDEKITWVDSGTNLLNNSDWYTYSDFSVTITDTPVEDVDNSAKKYYEDALEFRSWWQENIETIAGINSALKISITNDPENVNSEFTNYKNKIIHQKIQSNLDTAIAAYSNRASVSSEKFKMPTLLEDDWQKIYSNISVITFLQGVDIGFTQYNSYCVLNSTNHTEYANANSLQFIDGTHNNSIYHDIRDTKTIPTTGYRSNEFIGNRLITQPIANKNYWMYYYKHLDLACYDCINDAYVPEGDILNEITLDEDSKKSYYTALAREKYVTSKSTDNFDSGGRIHIDYTLKNEDNVTIASGQWTNKNVTLEVHPVTLELTNVKVKIGTNEFEEGVAAIVEYKPVANTTFKESVKVIVSGVNNFGILEEKEINIQIKIDKAKPVINSVIKDPEDWTNQNVTLTVDATDGDGQSGIDAYSFDGGISWQSYTITSPSINTKTYEENTNNIEIKVKDKAGNESLVKTTSIINIDKEPPRILNVEGNPTTWTKGPVELRIIAEDTGGSGIEKYSFDNKANWTNADSKVYDQNTQDIRVWVKDKAGNENDPEYDGNPIEINYIDNEKPWINVTKNEAQSNQVKIILDINAGDNISGIKIIKTPNGDLAPANSEPAKNYHTTYEITQNGTYTFEVEDYAGNTESKSINVVDIDTTPPSLNLQYNDVITRGNIPITVTASDAESGIVKIKLPDNSEITGSGTTYTATANGTYTFTATNGVGLTTTKTATITRIDKEAPISLELSASPTGWTTGNVTITARATDNPGGSGISKITLRGGGAVEGSTGTFTVTTNGTYQFIAEDYAGNTLTNSITISNIDKSVPTLTAQYSNYIVTIKVADTGGSGIDYNSLKVEGTTYTYNTTKGCWEVNIIDFIDGENTITIQDNAGNTGTLVYTRNSFNMVPKNSFVVNMQRTHFKWNMVGSDSWKATVSIPDDSVYKKLYTKYSVTYSFKELGKTEFGSDVHKVNLGMNDSFEMEYTSKNNVNADLNMTIRFDDKSGNQVIQIDCVLSTSMAWYGNKDRRVWINGNLIDDNTTVFKVDLYNSGRINSDEYWFQFSEW